MNEQALKSRLKVIAKEKNMMMNQIWKQLLLERFLARVSRSIHHQKFIFKGGLLLAHYLPIQRETIDIDFLVNKIKNEKTEITRLINDIIAVDLNDDFKFGLANTKPLNQPHMEYEGIRVSLAVKFGKMIDEIQVDIATGDSVQPIEESYTVFMYKSKPIFAGEISLLCYPRETIFAEKLETIISKGSDNSRMKDYHDVLLMIREPNFLVIDKLKHDLDKTFANRGTDKNYQIIIDEDQNLQNWWGAHIRKLGKANNILQLPTDFNEVVEEINRWLNKL